MPTYNIKQLRQDRADIDVSMSKLKLEAREILADGDRSNAQKARLNAIEQELLVSQRKATLNAVDLAEAERLAHDEIRQATGTAPGAHFAPPAIGRTYRQMFPQVALDTGGFTSSEEFLATIHSGLADPRLMATNTGTIPSEGGFSVPSQIFSQWLDASLENEIVRSRCDVRPMTSSDASAVGWDDGDHSSTLFGGFSGQWIEEGGDITAETPKLRLINLHARKLAILARVSNELIADGMGFEQQLGTAIVKALGWFLDRAFLSGAGAAGPQGILNHGATITVTKENGQSAATINYENVSKMFSRLTPGSHERAVWVCNATAIPQLLQLSIATGTGGNHVPVLSETGGQMTMLTRPILFTEKAQTLGTKGDIGLYDFSQYVVGLRADFTLAKSAHAGFASDTSYYRGLIRVDGQPKLNAAITPYKGTTVSPFVVLADRA